MAAGHLRRTYGGPLLAWARRLQRHANAGFRIGIGRQGPKPRRAEAGGVKHEPFRVDERGMRAAITLGALIGSVVGGAVPGLWGADGLSGAANLASLVGMIAGAWAGVKVGDRLL